MAAMRLAKDYAKECDVDVVLMRVYNAIEEPHVLPEGFIESPHPLQRTAIDAMNDASAIAAARKFGVPEYALIQGIIDEAIAANTGADWVVLTNADVMPFPSSYVVMALLSEAGPDVLSYTRMGVPKHAKDAAHGPTTLHLTAFEKYMRAISTPPRELTRHPGIDGFGLKADLMPCRDFGNAHWGCAPFGQLAWSELRRVSQSCAMWIDGVSNVPALIGTASSDVRMFPAQRAPRSGPRREHPPPCGFSLSALIPKGLLHQARFIYTTMNTSGVEDRCNNPPSTRYHTLSRASIPLP